MRSYAIKMGLRVVFFVAGAIIAVTWNKWIGLILMGVSAVLPWFAVMGANLIRPPEQVMGAEYAKAKRQEELHAEPRHEKDGSSRGSVTIEGELAEDEESKGKDEDS
jgi:Na+(H+)/acetate symporter ActP